MKLLNIIQRRKNSRKSASNHPSGNGKSNPLNLFTLLSILSLSSSILVLAQDGAQPSEPQSGSGPSTLTETVTLSQPLATSSVSPTPTPSSSGSSSASTSAPTTSIPFVNLDGQPVPFLLQRPIDGKQLQSTSQSSSSSKRRRKRNYHPKNLLKRSRNHTPLTPDIYFSGCDDSDSINGVVDSNVRVNVSAIYAQLDQTSSSGNQNQAGGVGMRQGGPISGYQSEYQALLRITALASIQDMAYATDESRLSLSAMRVETTFLTFSVYSNNTFLCDQVYPTGPDTVHPIIPPSCTYGPGPLAFGAAIPLNHTYGLGTLWTTIRLVDPSSSARNIACVRVAVSPYYEDSWYWSLFFWLPVALCIAYFVIGLIARIVTSVVMRKSAFKNRAREGKAPTFINDSLSPTVIASLSSQGLVSSPALLRFATPGLWDIILHTQWIAILGTFAVKWPEFVYPVLRQGAWAALLGNVTLVQSNGTEGRYNALATNAQLPSNELGTQIATNVSSPLYMNTEAPNVLLNLSGSRHGLDAFARMIGLAPDDVFGTCLAVWCALVAAILAISALVFILDLIYSLWTGAQRRREDGIGLRSSGDYSLDAKDLALDAADKRGSYGFIGNSSPTFRRTLGNHRSALHGNLIRALILFHLPITLFSTYQISEHAKHSLTSVALAGLSLALLGIIAPIYLIFRISTSTTQKLYDDTGTLLSLGPSYNTYSPGSQLFYTVTFTHSLIVGITLGAAQSSAAAQTIIFLVMEILLALASSLWLPWGDGAMQGPLSFLTSVLRIISAVLLILLTPLVGFGHEATSWITYVILLLQAIFFVLMTLVLLSKVLEALIRVLWKVPFDERASRNAGIGGVIRRIRRRKYKTIQISKAERKAKLDRNSNSTTQALIFSSAKDDTLNLGRTSPGMNTLGGKSSGNGFVGPRALAHSRQVSYASHLDPQIFGGGGSGTLPRTPMDHHLSENSPYSAYLRGDPNDEGIIMAALPPTTPGFDLPANQQNRSRKNSLDADTALNNPATPKSSFVRVGGGRATDASPYQSLPSRNNNVRNGERHRASNSSGTDLSCFVDPRSSYHALNNVSGNTHNKTSGNRNGNGKGELDFSSTALAQRSATINAKGKKRGAGGGVGGFWKRKGVKDDEDSTDDDDEFWNPNPSERGHGPWQGIAKMGGALAGFKNKLGIGHQVKESEREEEEEGDSLPPNPSAGFQVVRQPNRLRGNNNQTQSNEVTPSNSRPISASGIEAPKEAPASRAREDEDEDRPRVYTVQPPPFGSAAALALEAANSSALGHEDENGLGRRSEGGEERYWLPPGAAPPNPHPNQRSDTSQRRKSVGMQAVWQQESREKSKDEKEALENRRNLNQSSQNEKASDGPPQLPTIPSVNDGSKIGLGGLLRGSNSLESDRLTNSSTSRLAKMEAMSAEVIDANDDEA